MIYFEGAVIPGQLKKIVTAKGFTEFVISIKRSKKIKWVDAYWEACETFDFYYDSDPPASFNYFNNLKSKILGA